MLRTVLTSRKVSQQVDMWYKHIVILDSLPALNGIPYVLNV